MEAEPFVDRPPAAERPVPAGAARVAPFASAAEHAAALFELVELRLAAALIWRREAGLLDEAGEAASRRLLARIDHATAAELGELAAAAARRTAVFEARIEASRDRGIALPLEDAFDAWRLPAIDRAILAALLGAACSPVIARLLRCAGTAVEGVAAAIAPGHEGVLALDERLAADAPLSRLALVAWRGTARPLLARELAASPRLVALARGVVELDGALRGVTLQRERDPLVLGWTTPSAYHRLRGALARGTPLPVTWIAAPPGAGGSAIAADAALSLSLPALHVRQAAADPAWLDALAREALLHRAAIVALHDGHPLEPLLRRFERLPVPLVVIDELGGPRPALPLLHVELPMPSASDRETLWRRSLGSLERDCDLGALASALRIGAEAIDRAVAHASLVAAASDRPIAHADLIDGLRAGFPGALDLPEEDR